MSTSRSQPIVSLIKVLLKVLAIKAGGVHASLVLVTESFHRSLHMLVQALPHDKFQQLWTVCQIPDGSLEESSAPRILDPEHAQM